MKMKHLLVATAVALVPASASLADKAALEAAKKKKEEAKAKAIEEAKEKAKAEAEAKAKANAAAAAAAAAKKGEKAAAAEEAKKAEEEMHQKHLGIIERLEQIATATSNAELKTKVDALKAKEDKRHTLAIGG
jgi:colicin import membrane protein